MLMVFFSTISQNLACGGMTRGQQQVCFLLLLLIIRGGCVLAGPVVVLPHMFATCIISLPSHTPPVSHNTSIKMASQGGKPGVLSWKETLLCVPAVLRSWKAGRLHVL